MSNIAWQIHRQKIVDSTNTQAATLIHQLWNQNQPAHGHAIIADQQTAGRGQHGRSWESPAGGLYVSAVIEEVHPSARDKLALIAGVAVAYALQGLPGLQLGLRWPNDVLLDNKKLGGILCESIVQGTRWAGIIGIGLNINVHVDRFPKDVQRHATSLLAHDGRRHNLREIELSVMGHIANVLHRVSYEGIAPVVKHARFLDTLRGHPVELEDGERIIHGIAAGIGDSGELLIQTSTATIPCTTGSLLAVAGQRLNPSKDI